MRTVRYKVIPAINPFGGPVPHTHGSLVELMFHMPYLFVDDVILSLFALNEVFLSGVYDRGMSGGCQWRPFQINEEEYEELVLELLTRPGETSYTVEPSAPV